MPAATDLALYIHWPFCLKKCPYCDFNSHVRESVDADAWRAALLADMAHEHRLTADARIGSIFFGGGTPSLMPPALAGALIEEAQRLWGLAPDAEITLEANPTSYEAGKFAEFRAAGVNRVSLGVQSLHDEALAFLGRKHSAAEAIAALESAQALFGRVSFDLIYARPGQSAAEWEAELARALAFGTEHLSLYQLTIEPGTGFAGAVARGRLTPMDPDEAADLFVQTQEQTRAAGLPAYEISNHAHEGAQSHHNLTYWRYRDYVGIGPGAHGRRGGHATIRHKKPEAYLRRVTEHGHGMAEERALGREEQLSEALLMGLRLAEGVDLAALAARFGTMPGGLIDERRATFYAGLGFVERDGSRITVTEQGMPLLDALLAELVPADLCAA
ncbi:radical SAM family heme chaperone HemW [Alteriqipengyuania lutimaris]|uniref:Heme chaperone HemW n=1 Tax=Alteriqipengyuania lutimaris TaxID=1538146 RepID=A0A395LLV4_9SPHN|nr:radical SAM family heme chaperone HemW [Alteriqipengyuania lutimaris]MBB3032899.1 oxygen-independent coproporphyrinogen-3 oxidase [Alteriqipengyuania lutimaris]RDS78013.1 coproporphyrinogen III oxidase [Alteriqipengyuania lutimaris]